MGTLINLSNCKQEIRHHLRLFLSNKNDCVVLPAELCPAPSVDLIPPFTGLHSIFHTHQHLNYDLFHQVHFSRCRPRLSCLISTAAFSTRTSSFAQVGNLTLPLPASSIKLHDQGRYRRQLLRSLESEAYTLGSATDL